MPDPADYAQEAAEHFLKVAHANRVRPVGESLTHCTECGEPISDGRRKAMPGCTKCIDCAE